jgi:phage gpG-like protein
VIKVEVKGLEKVRKLLNELKRAGLKPGNAYDLVGQRMVAMQKRHFSKQEGPEGEPWEPLDPKTIARRRGGRTASTKRGKLGVAGLGRPVQILRDTGTMYKAIIYKADDKGAEAGVAKTIPYAATHQFGDRKRHIPARPFIYINTKEAKILTNLFARELLKILHGEGSGGLSVE